MSPEISQLAVVFVLVTVFGLLAWRLRQPMIIAFVLTGIVIGHVGSAMSTLQPLWKLFSDFGIALLLFLVGLEIDYPSLRRVGTAALIVGLGQVVITFVAGYFLSLLLGLSTIGALYVALALTFSSTVLVVKLLSEKNELGTLHGKITLGILLMQDVVAMVILLFLGSPAHTGNIGWDVTITLAKGLALFFGVFWVGRVLMPRLFATLAHSRELLFLGSLGWLLLMAVLAEKLGFSLAAGGFLAGLSLANSSTHWQIASRIRPLRDFFIALFFIFIGSTVQLGVLVHQWWLLLALSAFVLIGNPLIIIAIMRNMGYHHRTSFLTGINIAQVSEFSFILLALGVQVGHLDVNTASLVTAVGVITIIISSSMIAHSNNLYRQAEPVLFRLLGAVSGGDDHGQPEPKRPIVLIGAHRTGQNILAYLKPHQVVAIDFDPDVVSRLRRKKYRVIFGDAGDENILDLVDWTAVRLVISTSPEIDDQETLLHYVASLGLGKRIQVVLRADSETSARQLYRHGADYVLLPFTTAGQYLGRALALDPLFKHLGQLRQKSIA